MGKEKKHRLTSRHPLVGKWLSVFPWESEDYLCEYSISVKNGNFIVSGEELETGESFKISEARWDGEFLSFISLMSSTNRWGLNRFRVVEGDRVECTFTFTVTDYLLRKKDVPKKRTQKAIRKKKRAPRKSRRFKL